MTIISTSTPYIYILLKQHPDTRQQWARKGACIDEEASAEKGRAYPGFREGSRPAAIQGFAMASRWILNCPSGPLGIYSSGCGSFSTSISKKDCKSAPRM